MTDLAAMHEELTSLPELPEVEWTRLRALEFQEVLRQRTTYLDRIAKLGCQLCENFEDHVSELSNPAFVCCRRRKLITVRYIA